MNNYNNNNNRRQGKNEMLLNVRKKGDGRVVSVLAIQPFFVKESFICTMNKHTAESNINILLTRNLPVDSGVRQWSHPLMIPLHCFWAKSNNRMPGQFECDVTWFCFCFNSVCPHAQCCCCSIFCWRGWGVFLKLDVQG